MGDTIIGVQFGIANPDDILKRSVVEVTTDKTYQSSQAVPNGMFDPRFGVIENGKICPTCKLSNQYCSGHFGHIQLSRPVYLYQFFDTVEKLCNILCLTCSKPLLDDAHFDEVTSTGMARFKDVRDLTAKGKRAESCPHCNSPLFKKIAKAVGRVATLEGHTAGVQNEPAPVPTPLQVELVLRAFQRITDADCARIGFSPRFSRPEWMICTVLAVPPLTVRPSVVMDDNQRMEDDLTHKLVDVLRNNQRLRDKIDKGESIETIDKYTAMLQYDVATYVDNEIKGLQPAAQRSGRPLRTLKSRFGAKTGRVRGNLMGKRVDFSARSVITPDANIELDELGVPFEIATNLTFPEVVSMYNRDRLLEAVANGPEKHPGAKSVFLKQDKRMVSLRYVTPDTIDLRDGDIVHRHLVDGDIVLFNRQPSLHKASMMAHRVRVLPYSTFRLNVSATRPYNADFDGDEMNMHVPQSIAAAMELRYLASVLRNIISPRTNSPIIQLFQDTMTGAYRISQESVRIPEHLALNMLSKIKRQFPRKNRPWTGSELISAAFPLMDFAAGGMKVKNGQLTSGVIVKGAIGKMIHVVFNDFGCERAGQLINDMQSIVTQFNLYYGFSVGTADLIANEATRTIVNQKMKEGRDKVAQILTDVHSGTFLNISSMTDGEDLEDKISSALKKVTAEINEEVLKSLSGDNRIVQMVKSGSKGSDQNITQMVALLGQQNIEGKRVQYTLQDRTLPHFARYDDGIESRGFVQNSFVNGLMPAEFFYHAQAGREGLIDTAVKTSDTGYIQRRLMKIMEDQHIEYNGSVRNVTGSIVQFSYGEDGIDTTCVESQPCELSTMTMEAVYRMFALSPADVNSFLKEPVDVCPDLVDDILADRDLLVKTVFRYRKNGEVQAPVHIGRLLEKYANPYGTKTDLTPQHVVEAIGGFIQRFPKNRVFHALLRYNLAPKQAILVHRLTEALFDELMRDIEFKYTKSLCHAGEMVGALAAQSIGEPTTQLTLNTFHSAGTVKANATSGVPRIEELLSASANPKRPGNTAYLLGMVTQKEAIAKKKEIQRTTIRDITRSFKIYYDPYPLSTSTVVDADRDLLEAYNEFDGDDGDCASRWIVRIVLNEAEMVSRKVMDMTEIATKLHANASLKMVRCVAGMEGEVGDGKPKNLVLRLAFDEVIKNPNQLRYLEEKILDTPLTGLDDIGRVHIRTVKNELILDETVGGYVCKEQYVLDVEGTNLHELMMFPGVDPTRSFSNDIHEINDVFGIEAARLALFEELSEVFVNEKVNYHHLSVLIDSMTFSGRIVPVSRFGMGKTDSGVLAKSSFEETSKIMFNAAMGAEFDPMRGVSANIMFGQKPPCGTGFVDVLVDEMRLPEGPEILDDPMPEILKQTNKEIAETAPSECRMEDILMSW
uniref:DNA-directed RNA polymerase n=1 Tax=viral metagenome TaxID=1070528 RepID=A0A6C0J2W5_9ZZZZ